MLLLHYVALVRLTTGLIRPAMSEQDSFCMAPNVMRHVAKKTARAENCIAEQQWSRAL